MSHHTYTQDSPPFTYFPHHIYPGFPPPHIPWISPTTYTLDLHTTYILDFPHHIYPGFPPPTISWISPTTYTLDFPYHIYPGFPLPHIPWISSTTYILDFLHHVYTGFPPTYHILKSYLLVKKKQISLDNKYNSIFPQSKFCVLARCRILQ